MTAGEIQQAPQQMLTIQRNRSPQAAEHMMRSKPRIEQNQGTQAAAKIQKVILSRLAFFESL
ncbi:MAG: hypothetical protein AAFQ89_01375 [Cyanobacteria bacterium J06626_18]